jgi:hypothetical protein
MTVKIKRTPPICVIKVFTNSVHGYEAHMTSANDWLVVHVGFGASPGAAAINSLESEEKSALRRRG